MSLQIGNAFVSVSPVWIDVIVVVVVYMAGTYIEPFGDFLAFIFGLIEKLLFSLKELLEEYNPKQTRSDVKYPALRTVFILVALVLAVIVLTADTFGAMQALSALFGGAIDLPALPAFFNYAMGALFVSSSALAGSIWLEGKIVPEEARLFDVHTVHAKEFQRFVFTNFLLSVVATVAYFVLKPFFLANPDSGATHLLQLLVFVLLSVLLPMIAAICLYILGIGFHAIFSMACMIAWFIVSTSIDVCEYLRLHFSKDRVPPGGAGNRIIEQAPNSSKELSPPSQVITPTLPRVLPDGQPKEPEKEPSVPEQKKPDETQALNPFVPETPTVEQENGHVGAETDEFDKKKA